MTHIPDRDWLGSKLLFQFHGAVDQTKRTVPTFQDIVPPSSETQDCLGLSIADQTLECSAELKAAWYQGSSQFDLCGAIACLVRHLKELCQASRVIFVGSSIGGHAALVQSSYVPDSVCVVNNPIASMSRYYSRHLREYLQYGWPGVERIEDVPFPIVDDCAVLYQGNYQNQLVIIQNPTDHHFHQQAIQFVKQITWQGNAMMFAEFDPELIGHKFSPPNLRRWAMAALTAPSDRCLDIAQRHHHLKMMEFDAKTPMQQPGSTAPSSITPPSSNRETKQKAVENETSRPSFDRFEHDSEIASRLAAAAKS